MTEETLDLKSNESKSISVKSRESGEGFRYTPLELDSTPAMGGFQLTSSDK